jgi:hypothetical protein
VEGGLEAKVKGMPEDEDFEQGDHERHETHEIGGAVDRDA